MCKEVVNRQKGNPGKNTVSIYSGPGLFSMLAYSHESREPGPNRAHVLEVTATCLNHLS